MTVYFVKFRLFIRIGVYKYDMGLNPNYCVFWWTLGPFLPPPHNICAFTNLDVTYIAAWGQKVIPRNKWCRQCAHGTVGHLPFQQQSSSLTRSSCTNRARWSPVFSLCVLNATMYRTVIMTTISCEALLPIVTILEIHDMNIMVTISTLFLIISILIFIIVSIFVL